MHRSGAGNVASRVGGPGSYDGKIAGLYDLEKTLGSGHFAVVKLARHVFTGEKVAVKVIDKSKLDDMSRSHLFQEVRCMKLVQHPNVIRLYEVIDTQTKLYLILELGDGGDLYDYIMRHHKGLSETLARDYFRQIVRAISYCHRLHVVHRDLKPENVVFFERLGTVKLTDFGFSNKFSPGQKLETSCGSLAYSAPEILLGDSYDAPAVDVWSLGVILYMLVCGQAPFHEANDSETLTMIMDCKYTMPQNISAPCKKLIGRMLVRQPEKRATLSEIADDPWLLEGSGTNAERPDDEPLVSKQHLSEEDHTLIIQKMVSGHIASKEQILDALEKDSYNHITATYFLLAERKLRAQRQEVLQSERASALVSQEDMGVSSPVHNPNLLQLPVASPVPPRTAGDIPARTRKCSIVREEDDDEDGVPEEACIDGAAADARRGSRSEGRLHMTLLAAGPELPFETPPIPVTPVSSVTPAPIDRHHATTTVPLTLAAGITKVNLTGERLRSAPVFHPPVVLSNMPGWMSFGKKFNCFGDHIRPKSAIEHGSVNNNVSISAAVPKIKKPVINITKVDGLKAPLPLLNEDEVSCDKIGVEFPYGSSPTSRSAPPAPSLPRRHRLDCRRRRSRASSCSSSDLSDEDSSESGRKKRSPSEEEQRADCALTLRRDSHDDSSDSQERGAAGGSAGGSVGCGSVTRTSSTARPASGGGGSAGGGNNNNVGGKGRSSGRNGGADDIPRRHRRGGVRRETRLRESRSLNRITEVVESANAVVTSGGGTDSGVRWAVRGGLAALCSRPFLKLVSRRGELLTASPACRLHAQQCCGLC